MTYKNRLPWMTKQLCTQIDEKNEMYHEVEQHRDNVQLAIDYKQKRNQTISDLRNAEISYYSNQLEVNKNDMGKSWKVLKSIIGKGNNNMKRKMRFNINGTIVTDCQTIANGFNDFFVSIGTELANHITSNVNALTYVQNVANSIVIPFITSLEIRTVILKLNNSSSGWDEIPPFLAKDCVDSYLVPLTRIINASIEEGIFPNELKLARVVPLYKAGDSSLVTNYRPISVLSFFFKNL